jgi:hypothetical protein
VQKLKDFQETDGVSQPNQRIAMDFISGSPLAKRGKATAQVVSVGDSPSFPPVVENLLTNQLLSLHKSREPVKRPPHCPLMQFS